MASLSKLFIAFCILAGAEAFNVGRLKLSQRLKSSTEIGIFGDALKGAFSNDSNLGKPQNSGLTNVRKNMTVPLLLFTLPCFNYRTASYAS